MSSLSPSSSLSSSAPSEIAPGQLLDELEQRQNDVLAQLDELDAKLTEVLKGLGATMDGEEKDSDAEELPMAA
ncbi:hypothetical protein [Planctomycetes bacterium K23_9]